MTFGVTLTDLASTDTEQAHTIMALTDILKPYSAMVAERKEELYKEDAKLHYEGKEHAAQMGGMMSKLCYNTRYTGEGCTNCGYSKCQEA
ncbi:hypothetical protein PM082_022016 [Marasmius tenuissimus]|nr:hypothetical protein PM082_022016 [Marasmius tenuissimus]